MVCDRLPLIVTAAVVIRNGRVLAARRKTGAHLESLWEFPGGKLEPDESPEEGLARELREELGVEIRVNRVLDAIYHRYPERNVLLLFYACDLVDGEPRPIDVAELAWIGKEDIVRLNWAPADTTFLRRLAEDFLA